MTSVANDYKVLLITLQVRPMDSLSVVPRTPAEVRSWFFEEGLAVSAWALQHGFRPQVVYALLAGRTRGSRGQAHCVAVALGLKRGPAGTNQESNGLARATTKPNSQPGAPKMT